MVDALINTLPYQEDFVVPASYIDALGHMNNVRYLELVERIAWAHSCQLGMTVDMYKQLDTALIARAHELSYLKACLEHETLRLTTWLTQVDALNVYRAYAFYNAHDQLVFQATTRWVCVKLSTGKPQRMPLVMQQAYQRGVWSDSPV